MLCSECEFSLNIINHRCLSCAILIKKLKFDHQLCIGDFFAPKLQEKYQKIVAEFEGYDAIIPLPLARGRIQERGYNQTHELLRIIAKRSKKRYAH